MTSSAPLAGLVTYVFPIGPKSHDTDDLAFEAGRSPLVFPAAYEFGATGRRRARPATLDEIRRKSALSEHGNYVELGCDASTLPARTWRPTCFGRSGDVMSLPELRRAGGNRLLFVLSRFAHDGEHLALDLCKHSYRC